MNLKYKIVRLDLAQHSIVVRYYTDLITEDMLCTYRAPTGEIVTCATDYNFNLPIPVPEGQVLIDFIQQRAPVDWLATKEAVLDPQTDTSMAALQDMVGKENLQTIVASQDTRTALEKAKAGKLQEIASWRYARETAGIQIGALVMRTDRESQAQLAATLACFENQFVAQVDWKGENGWVTLDETQVKDVAATVATHVQACFSQEKMFAEQVSAAATVEDVAAIVLPAITIPVQVV